MTKLEAAGTFSLSQVNEFGDVYKAAEVERLRSAFRQQVYEAMMEPVSTAKESLANPGPSGAETIGNDLQKCPHEYCQIGSFTLKALDGIFGSSSSELQIKQTWDVTESMHWDQTQARDYEAAASAVIRYR